MAEGQAYPCTACGSTDTVRLSDEWQSCRQCLAQRAPVPVEARPLNLPVLDLYTRMSVADGQGATYYDPEDIAALLERLRMAEAKAAVLGGEACAEERAAGNGPCGACAWCCAQWRDRAERAEASRDRFQGLVHAETVAAMHYCETHEMGFMCVDIEGVAPRCPHCERDALRTVVDAVESYLDAPLSSAPKDVLETKRRLDVLEGSIAALKRSTR